MRQIHPLSIDQALNTQDNNKYYDNQIALSENYKNVSSGQIIDKDQQVERGIANEEQVGCSPSNMRQHKITQQQDNAQRQHLDSVVESNNGISCKICLLSSNDDESKDLGDFINICNCKGSIQYVHYFCQKDYLESRFGKTKNQLVRDIQNEQNQMVQKKKKQTRFKGVKFHKCDLCNYEYQAEWKSKLIKRPFTHIKAKKSCLLFTFITSLVTFILLLTTVLYLSLIQYKNADQLNETIFSFIGFLLASFAFVCNCIILFVVMFKLFLVRTYYIYSIKHKQKLIEI